MKYNNLSAIAAMSTNRVIGLNNTLPWKCSDDLKFFKATTIDSAILMGRNTFESIGSKPLPRRKNIVVSRELPERDDITIIRDLNDLIIDQKTFLIGGAMLYKELLPKCSELYLTLMKSEYIGDTYMPEFEHLFSDFKVLAETDEYAIRLYN